MNAHDAALRAWRSRLDNDVHRTRHGLGPLATADRDWEWWRLLLHSRIELAFRYATDTGAPDFEFLESAVGVGLACMVAVDAADLVRVEAGA